MFVPRKVLGANEGVEISAFLGSYKQQTRFPLVFCTKDFLRHVYFFLALISHLLSFFSVSYGLGAGAPVVEEQ